MNPTIDDLRDRMRAANEAAQDIAALAATSNRDLTEEEKSKLEGHLADFDRIEKEIALLEKLGDQTSRQRRGVGRTTQPDQPGENLAVQPNPNEYAPRERQTPVGDLRPATGRKDMGFRTFGEYALAVKRAGFPGGPRSLDERLYRCLPEGAQALAPTTYSQEGVGADGGFIVPPDYRAEIMTKVMGEDSLLARCDQVMTGSNVFQMPKDEDTPWSTSGIQAYWDGEAQQFTQSKALFQSEVVKLNKLTALVPVSDELGEDAPAIDTYLRRKAPEKINYKVNQAIVQGTGVGMPLGILNADSTVSVADESPQTADTLIALNVIKMYTRMWSELRSGAIWLINQDIEPELAKLSLPGVDNAGNTASNWGIHLYQPPGGLSATPYGTLYGRPVVPTQACETLGDKGDIIFVNLSQYLALLRSGPNPRVDISMHLWFDYAVSAYRFILRMGGQPWWASTIAARDGSTTYSWAVTLDARAG